MLFKDVIQALTLAGVPGQMNWMPPPQAPMGCPPGLEYLTAIDQVLVQQQIELLEGMLFMHSSYLNNLQKFVVYAYAVFRLERFTEVGEFTYLGKHFPCVNAN